MRRARLHGVSLAEVGDRTGFMNTAANAASAISSVVFGYMVGAFGSYNVPLIPMVAALCVGTWLWLEVDPSRQIFEEEAPLTGAAAAVAV